MLVRGMLLILLFLSFLFGATFGHYKYPPFYLLYNLKASLFGNHTIRAISDSNKFDSCNLPVVNKVPHNSHVFIGHAYGSPRNWYFSDYLAPNVLNFIKDNKYLLKTVTFTGDIFSVPSLSKFNRLSSEFSQSQKIFISPGNHDVFRPDSRDIFNLSIFGSKSYPFVETLDELPVIFDDSVISDWMVSDETQELINSQSSKNVIIARHNMPVVDLLYLANQSPGMSPKLPRVEEFVKRFSKNVNYTWVLGDSGAVEDLPRLTCLTYLNHTFISNGIGEISGDSVVLYKNGAFFNYVL
jgi:hypothetical protein